ncbi:MAG: hypothetical protein ACRERX_16300 [Pseudomonas sp.]
MVTRIAIAGLLLAGMAACTPAGRCTKGSELVPSMCPLKLPAITGVTIRENAAIAPAETNPAVSCTSFRVREEDVRRYFARARLTNANDAHHTLDWSPCYASGEVTFADGRTGGWTVSQLRTGSLVIGTDQPMVLYCPDCDFSPFQ